VFYQLSPDPKRTTTDGEVKKGTHDGFYIVGRAGEGKRRKHSAEETTTSGRAACPGRAVGDGVRYAAHVRDTRPGEGAHRETRRLLGRCRFLRSCRIPGTTTSRDLLFPAATAKRTGAPGGAGRFTHLPRSDDAIHRNALFRRVRTCLPSVREIIVTVVFRNSPARRVRMSIAREYI